MKQRAINTVNNSLIGRLEEFQRLLLLTLPKIEQQWLWQQPNTQISCIGVQLSHMTGNLRQYIVTNLSGQADQRQRADEFKTQPDITLEALSSVLISQLKQAQALIKETPTASWSEIYHVQTFTMTRLEACIHGVEHLNYHLGQIALLIKYYKPQDLNFYPEIS